MKRAHLIIFAALALVTTLALGTAFAADKGGVYIGVKGGYEYMDHSKGGVTTTNSQNATNESWSDKNGYTIGGAIGYNFAGMGVPVRAEAEYLYHNQFKYFANNSTGAGGTGQFSSKIDVHTVFANFYYDIKTSTAFTPYVGAGLGVAWINQKVASTFTGWTVGTDDGNYDTTNFAWNVGAGVGYALTDSVTVDLGYRYTSFGNAKAVSNAANSINFRAKDLNSHEALLGLRYQF